MTTALIFDLDGTLWDASESTAAAWSETFAAHGLPGPVTSQQIREVAGKPYLECLRIICPSAFDVRDFEQLVKDLGDAERKWMERIGGEFYPGSLEAVKSASSRLPVFLVSNCNDWYLEAFLLHSGLRTIFSGAICYGTTGLPKAENIRSIVQKFAISWPVYLGDTKGDMEASLQAGASYVHFASGFGGTEMTNSWHTLSNYGEFQILLERVIQGR